MTAAVRRIAAPALAAVGAVWWAYALTVLQPGIQAERPGVMSVGNNAYWVREVRWAMILLVLVALVWACRGDRVRSGIGVLGALAWTGADVWLDRIDVAGATWATAALVGALAAAAVIAASLRAPEEDRRLLVVAACIAAVAAGLVVGVQSPTDTEPGLRWSGAVVGALGALLAVGCALTLARRRVIGAGALAVSAVLVAVPASSPLGEPAPAWPSPVLMIVLVWTVLVAAWTPESAAAWALSLPATAFGVFAVGFLVLPLAIASLGAPATALAGNPAVNAADTDLLHTAIALVEGVGVGLVISVFASRARPGRAPVAGPAAA